VFELWQQHGLQLRFFSLGVYQGHLFQGGFFYCNNSKQTNLLISYFSVSKAVCLKKINFAHKNFNHE
jgi:hypothetical protein